MIFDWHKSNVGVNAQSVGIIHDEKHYLLTASPTIKPGEYQAMCNAVRVTKDLFGTITEAKAACEKWYRREVLGETVDVEAALATFLQQSGIYDSEAARMDPVSAARLLIKVFRIELK